MVTGAKYDHEYASERESECARPPSLRPFPTRRESASFGDELPFYGQILGITVAGAALVKWGELYLDFPFDPSYAAAAALILGPTALNAKKWADRSKDPSAAIESII